MSFFLAFQCPFFSFYNNLKVVTIFLTLVHNNGYDLTVRTFFEIEIFVREGTIVFRFINTVAILLSIGHTPG